MSIVREGNYPQLRRWNLKGCSDNSRLKLHQVPENHRPYEGNGTSKREEQKCWCKPQHSDPGEVLSLQRGRRARGCGALRHRLPDGSLPLPSRWDQDEDPTHHLADRLGLIRDRSSECPCRHTRSPYPCHGEHLWPTCCLLERSADPRPSGRLRPAVPRRSAGTKFAQHLRRNLSNRSEERPSSRGLK